VDFAALRLEYGDHFAILEELSDDFRKDLPNKILSLKNALAADDLETVARIAHKLKGSVGLFKGRRALEYVKKLEESVKGKDRNRLATIFDKLDTELHRIMEALALESKWKS
jgi:protein-histidine pros-kinase